MWDTLRYIPGAENIGYLAGALVLGLLLFIWWSRSFNK